MVSVKKYKIEELASLIQNKYVNYGDLQIKINCYFNINLNTFVLKLSVMSDIQELDLDFTFEQHDSSQYHNFTHFQYNINNSELFREGEGKIHFNFKKLKPQEFEYLFKGWIPNAISIIREVCRLHNIDENQTIKELFGEEDFERMYVKEYMYLSQMMFRNIIRNNEENNLVSFSNTRSIELREFKSFEKRIQVEILQRIFKTNLLLKVSLIRPVAYCLKHLYKEEFEEFNVNEVIEYIDSNLDKLPYI